MGLFTLDRSEASQPARTMPEGQPSAYLARYAVAVAQDVAEVAGLPIDAVWGRLCNVSNEVLERVLPSPAG